MIWVVQVYEPHSGAHFEINQSSPLTDVVVVLVHGSLDRSSGMARVARFASQFATVIRFDRRGYGDRWVHPGPFNVEGNTDDVQAIIGDRHAVVIGHSYGGQIALATASRMGDQIRGVSVFETPLSWLPWWPSHTAGAAGIAAGPEKAAEAFMIRMIGQERWDSLPEKTRTERRREGQALVSELSALRQGPSWSIETVSCPVIVGCGSAGGEHQKQGTDWLVAHLHNCSQTVIEGASHGAHLSHPKEFVQQLIRPHFHGRGTDTEIS
ncbi:MAG: hypothetical protein RIR69_174 [Actinomycetota bacterium]|jgi:pimeloyl-ACP methyl ester carboxylesterase